MVFASVGPTGVMLMMGQVSADDVKAAFATQVRAIADAGADGIVIETMSDPAEAALAAAAAHETGLPVVACMTFDSGAKKDRTMMGAPPEQAAEQLAAAGADVIGSNCGQGIAGMVDVCRRLHAATDRPIWIKANAGLPEMIDGKTFYRQTPDEFAAYVPQLIEVGASFLGGCCGTTPDFIRAVAKLRT
jgi:methionine synthase I (cobalamin-dependent)